MSVRATSRRRHVKHQIGDLRERIEVGENRLRPSGFNQAGGKRVFTKSYDAWAKVETTQFIGGGEVRFNGVNIASSGSHVFTLRYREDLDTESWIRWRGEAYRIDLVRHPDERNEFTEAFAFLEGDQNRKANT